jgi:uncharacterized protein YlxW (UPF0749 family)
MNAAELGALIAAALSGGGLSAVITKYMSRGVDAADAAQKRSVTNASDVETLRNIIAEVRQSEARKSERIDALETRLDKLEERERHMLTRAAVHEAWDQLAFQRIILGDEAFPPPPPLSDLEISD